MWFLKSVREYFERSHMLMINFLLAVCHYLPWLVIGGVAGWMLRKRKGDKSLMLQALGGAAMFVLGMSKWLLVDGLLRWIGNTALLSAGGVIFEFLLFVSLLIFVAGYCMERFFKSKPAVVSASPA